MLHLTSLKVEGLLGRFVHRVPFPRDWEFVILHGPNGVGKTKLLELIAAVSAGRLTSLLRLPFSSAELEFDDGSAVQLIKSGQQPLPGVDGEAEPPRLVVRLRTAGEWATEFTVDSPAAIVGEKRLIALERELPIERVERDLWYDFSHSDHIDAGQLTDRYGSYLGLRHHAAEIPPEFEAFREQFPVHLIETQRLLMFGKRRRGPNPSESVQRSTVISYAEDLTRRLSEALAQNSRTSQDLDRTFPRRVLGAAIPSDITDLQIRERYEEQIKLRDRLADIAVLDTSADVPLPDRELHDWERRVLWIYLEDTDLKLATFNQLLGRVRLMRDIVNERFLFKQLKIDRDRGFRFETEDSGEIGPDQLSSGEQHELVLLYDLLFNVPPEATVLIDEPEISLHISWQQQFLNDIEEIAQLASLRFILATHSPQIIHKRWDRTVPLYGGERGKESDAE